MNRNKVVTFNCIALSFILAVLFVVSIKLYYGQEKNVPDLIEYKKINSQGIDFEKFKDIKNEKNENLILTGYSELKCDIKNGYGVSANKDVKTKMVLTDDQYFSLYPNEFVSGGKIDYISVKEGNKIAVISEKLAIDIYKNINIIGNSIEINGETYKIVGVYRTDESFVYNASEDGYERIIVPYSSYKYNTKEKLNIDVLSVKGNNITNKEAGHLLEDLLGANLSLYNKEDFSLLKYINFQYIKLIFFVMGCYMIIILFKLMIKYFKNFILFVKRNFQDLYLKEFISEKRKEIIVFIMKITVLLVLMITIFSLVKFNLVIDDKYLPTDNIFNFDFYRKAIIKDIQIMNAKENGFGNIYNRYLMNISNIQKPILISQVISFFLFSINLSALIKGKKSNKPRNI